MTILAMFAATIGLMASCGGQSGSAKGTAAIENKQAQAQSQTPLLAAVSLAGGNETKQGETVRIVYAAKEGAVLDSAVLHIGGKRVAAIDSTGYAYRIPTDHPTGRVLYKIVAYSGDKSDARSGGFTVFAAQAPDLYGHRVVRVYPHAKDAYTQGLLFHNGYLYESTGLNGGSSLRKNDIETGKTLQMIELPRTYFGEGLTLLDGKLYQLTWQNNTTFVYDLNTFEKIAEYRYGGEGWGIATDGRMLYMSDGTERICVMDPDGFKWVHTLEVYTDRTKMMYINEMEWIDGEIWANIYTTDNIIRIDPRTGAVTGIIDMSGLLSQADITAGIDVLNGIAYDKNTGRIFVTGKNWNKLFEVEIFKK